MMMIEWRLATTVQFRDKVIKANNARKEMLQPTSVLSMKVVTFACTGDMLYWKLLG